MNVSIFSALKRANKVEKGGKEDNLNCLLVMPSSLHSASNPTQWRILLLACLSEEFEL